MVSALYIVLCKSNQSTLFCVQLVDCPTQMFLCSRTNSKKKHSREICYCTVKSVLFVHWWTNSTLCSVQAYMVCVQQKGDVCCYLKPGVFTRADDGEVSGGETGENI